MLDFSILQSLSSVSELLGSRKLVRKEFVGWCCRQQNLQYFFKGKSKKALWNLKLFLTLSELWGLKIHLFKVGEFLIFMLIINQWNHIWRQILCRKCGMLNFEKCFLTFFFFFFCNSHTFPIDDWHWNQEKKEHNRTQKRKCQISGYER